MAIEDIFGASESSVEQQEAEVLALSIREYVKPHLETYWRMLEKNSQVPYHQLSLLMKTFKGFPILDPISYVQSGEAEPWLHDNLPLYITAMKQAYQDYQEDLAQVKPIATIPAPEPKPARLYTPLEALRYHAVPAAVLAALVLMNSANAFGG